MPQIEATFVVEPYDITVTTDTSNIQVQPTVLDLNIFSAGYSNPAGNNGELQYNNAGVLGGVPVAFYTLGNVIFANVTNVKLPGGSNAYFLQTDGTGNITWAPGTINANTGPGVANGANTQIQMTDGTGNFVSAPGFTFNYVGNTLTVPGPGIFTGNIQSGNANLGNAAVANYFIGNVIGSLSNGTSNIRIFASGNIAFSVAGNANVGIFTDTGLITGNANITNANITNANISNLVGNANLTNLRVNSPEIALGQFAASSSNQSAFAIGIGYAAAVFNQGASAIAVGINSGGVSQGANGVALGAGAGYQNQGANSIAIGANAGYVNQAANTIILNATGANLFSTTTDAFYVKPIRNAVTANVLCYDNTTGEITFSNNASANYSNFAGQVTNAAQPNITSVGTLTSVTVTGTATAGNLSTGGNLSVSGNAIITGTTTVQQIKEKVLANSTGSTGTINYDLLTSAIILKTADATGNFTLNFRGNSTTTLNSVMNSNESMTCTYINQNGVTPYVLSAVQVDGITVVPVYSGPNANVGTGTINGKDMYTFNIIKTAANTYTIFATRNGYA